MATTPSTGFVIADRCAVCLRTQSELTNKLKRCAGCSGPMYCSKECQKKGWPAHKQPCRAQWKKREDDVRIYTGMEPPTPSNIAAPAPPETVAALTTAMLAWGELYAYTFTNMATAVVYRNGGFAKHVRSDPHAILFLVRPLPRTRSDSDGNPAQSFHLSVVRVVSRAEAEGLTGAGEELKESWTLWHANCRTREAAVRRQIYRDDSVECGVLPALYILQDSDVMSISTVVIHRLSPARDNLTDEPSLSVFEDITSHCLDVMHAGLVLQHPSGPGHRRLPDIGKMVRQKKREWRWEHLPGWDWTQSDYKLPQAMPRKTGLNAAKLWERFFYGC